MFVNFSESSKHILIGANKEKNILNHPYVGSEHLFLSLLKSNVMVRSILNKNGITYDKFKNKLVNLVGVGTRRSEYVLYTPMFKKILRNASFYAKENKCNNIEPEYIVISILDEEDGIAYTILKTLNINIRKVYLDINKVLKNDINKNLLIEELGIDLNKQYCEGLIDPVLKREKETNEIIEILLRRKKNNPILVGPAGVGKTAIINNLAASIEEKKVPESLWGMRIISLDIYSLVAGTKYRGEFEDKMKRVIRELEENPNIILFVDEVHTIVGAGGAEGAIDASNILKPVLARGSIKLIGATTNIEYEKYIEKDLALARRFQKVNIDEPSLENVIYILKKIKGVYEKYHNVRISNYLLEKIPELSSKFLPNRFEPDRSIDILDDACIKASFKNVSKEGFSYEKERISALKKGDYKKAILCTKKKHKEEERKKEVPCVTKKDVMDALFSKCNLNQKKNYYLIKKMLIKKYGKTVAIDFVNALNVESNRCFSALVIGDDLKKLEFSKDVAGFLSSKRNIIVLNMALYNNNFSIDKLTDSKNNVFDRVKNNSNIVLILDNIDMASENVIELFKNIIKKGSYDDARGYNIDFSNTFIFLTKSRKESEIGFNKSTFNDLNEFGTNVTIDLNKVLV